MGSLIIRDDIKLLIDDTRFLWILFNDIANTIFFAAKLATYFLDNNYEKEAKIQIALCITLLRDFQFKNGVEFSNELQELIDESEYEC